MSIIDIFTNRHEFIYGEKDNIDSFTKKIKEYDSDLFVVVLDKIGLLN